MLGADRTEHMQHNFMHVNILKVSVGQSLLGATANSCGGVDQLNLDFDLLPLYRTELVYTWCFISLRASSALVSSLSLECKWE